MPYELDPKRSYHMPTHFGPAFPAGETLPPGEAVKAGTVASDVTSLTVSFLTDREQLEALLPAGKGLALRGEPVVSVTATYQGHLRWLAGRGYNLITVAIPAAFDGRRDHAVGNFLPVIWENMYEPIATGRESLGWSKIYAEIPPATLIGDKMHAVATWHGFKFLDLTVGQLQQLSADEVRNIAANPPQVDGSLHYKYIPKTGVPGEADADYITLSTRQSLPATIQEIWRGEGAIQFHKATWEDLPTMFHIINSLAELEVRKIVNAMVVKQTGGSMGPTVILE